MPRFLISLFLAIMTLPTSAFDFEKLFMPGPVIAGHEEYEQKCENCHVRLKETTQQQLCLDCHEDIAVDQAADKGFHGRNKAASSQDCRVCHTDHKGRDAQIVWLDPDRFNHEDTDYPLTGRHQQAECLSCHQPDRKHRETPDQCFDCHEDNDVHKGELGQECKNCHSPKGWGSDQFDHSQTEFELKHSHNDVACDLCHIREEYKDTPKQCYSCHAIKDVHEQRFGDQCQECHSEKKWDESLFKHDRDTDYKLRGKHSKVDCHSCHSIADARNKKKNVKTQPRNCYSCHRLDDVHQGQNGKQCRDCHNENSWQESEFDHDRQTDFPLRGAHARTGCESCHDSQDEERKTDKQCYACHQHQDAHEEQLGKRCDRCHNDKSWWLEDVRFDHDLARYPLIGQHAVVGCESCHDDSRFQDTASECKDCHQQDDVHQQALGTDCAQCHNPNGWLIWQFDHGDTDFPLQDAHQQLHCHSCHYEPLEPETDSSPRQYQCIDCHNRDDVHEGNFGADCSQCHNQKDFKTIDIRNIRNLDR